MRLALHATEPVTTSAESNPLAHIEVELETETKQQDVAAGLQILVIFKNAGHETVSFQDPDDSIQVELLDEKGWPIPIPVPPPAALVNRGEEGSSHKNAARVLSLRPGEEHRAAIRIREIRTKDAKKMDIPRGRYLARVRVLLLAATAELPQDRSYRKLESPQIAFELGG